MLGASILILSLLFLLVMGRFYGRFAQRVYGPNLDMKMPCYAQRDGVDFEPLPFWRIFLIQLLNIAGLGPIFGALAGCIFGPVALLWIVFGCIFAGAIHDFYAAMVSAEHEGENLPEIVGRYLGKFGKVAALVLCSMLVLAVGVVFTLGPASMLYAVFPSLGGLDLSLAFWVLALMFYYFLATILPIQSLIGRAYPAFGLMFMAMTLVLVVSFFMSDVPILPHKEFFTNMHPNESLGIWPMLFVTIACGAISGFHATQSPLMVRCLPSMKQARSVFYGAMLAEGVITLIWCTIGLSFRDMITDFYLVEQASGKMLPVIGASAQNAISFRDLSLNNPGVAVKFVCDYFLGGFGATLAMLAVVVLPITSGDTALRSLRLMLADACGLSQKKVSSRLMIALPIFAIVIVGTQLDFSVAWRYLSWANQMLAATTLWTIAVVMRGRGRCHWIVTPFALMMSMVSVTYFFHAPECLGMPIGLSTYLGLAVTLLLFTLFLWKRPFSS